MTRVLHIIASPRGNASLSRKLGDAIIGQLKLKDPDTIVRERVLSDAPYAHLEEVHIAGFFTPEEQRTAAQLEAIQNSDVAIAEIREADVLVIGVPIYNFSITSGLKAYFDHIARVQETFRYSENGPEGLVKGKKAYIAIASGGAFDNDAMRPLDFATPYVRHFLSFIGITDMAVFRVEGTAIPDLQATAMDKALSSVAGHSF